MLDMQHILDIAYYFLIQSYFCVAQLSLLLLCYEIRPFVRHTFLI